MPVIDENWNNVTIEKYHLEDINYLERKIMAEQHVAYSNAVMKLTFPTNTEHLSEVQPPCSCCLAFLWNEYIMWKAHLPHLNRKFVLIHTITFLSVSYSSVHAYAIGVIHCAMSKYTCDVTEGTSFVLCCYVVARYSGVTDYRSKLEEPTSCAGWKLHIWKGVPPLLRTCNRLFALISSQYLSNKPVDSG